MARRPKPCYKWSYPDRDVADRYRPHREATVGALLYPYACDRRSCRPLGVWHLTSKRPQTGADRWKRKRRNRQAAARLAAAAWHDDGGTVFGVPRW